MDIFYFIGLLIGSLGAGALVGLIPWFLGKKRGNQSMGKIGLITCIVAGFIGGFTYAVPVAIIFAVIIIFF